MATPSSEHRIPTESFLIPGQQGFIIHPWEAAKLSRVRVPPAPKAPPPLANTGNTLDERELEADPCAGWELGACQIIRRLSPGSVKSLLAVRTDPTDGRTALVVLRRIELPEVFASEVQTHAQSAARFRHPHLGRVFNCEVSDEGIFWVSERVSGATLAELTACCRKMGKGLPLGLALSAVHEAALALTELHEPNGFHHGLVSDQSVALGFDGVTRLQDVGLFRSIARQSSWGEVLEQMGPYLAPEQMLSGHLPDPRCDVFSLGAVLYECLSGQKLVRATNFDDRVKKHLSAGHVPPSSLNITLGNRLDEVVATALSADRSKRYRTAREFAQALKQASSEFMWRSELRAEFVGKLFDTRRRREQVLLAGCSPRRSITSLQLPMAPTLPPPLPVAAAVKAPVAVAAPIAPIVPRPVVAARRAVTRRPPTQVRALLMTLAASALAWIAWSGEVSTNFVPLDPIAPPRIAAPVIAAPLAPLPELESVPAELPQALVCVEETPVVSDAPAPVAAVEKPIKKLRKRKKVVEDDVPLAPWLQPKRRGRR